ncbi:MAG: filamentous hemagglutinin N-terminal domain-containing protein [Commensalibacter sp.]
MPKVKNRFTAFRVSAAYKRIQTLIISGLFFAGNLVSTWPIMANPVPSANIVVDMNVPANQRPTIDVTPNGVDQINIAHPNNAGVSHNRFNQYNVNEQGQILNNASTITNTKLAGQIIGNPHLKDGKNARLILNEVTGYSPTRLLGYTEIAGKQAALIIANPSGITCAGCGFINTARTSLATGKPNLDANGYLQSLTVSGGEIGFDGKGGNFAEVPVLDIISRKVRINAPVNGQDIRIVAGRNSYHYDDGTATPLASDGSTAPEFAIETSVLGGMTGNHIQMLVNEKGAGVRVDGRMASTAGDMELTADGKLVVSGDLTAQNQFKARVTTVENTGTLGANNGLSLQASSLTNSGKIIAAGNQESAIAVDNNLDNSGSIITQPALRLTAQKMNNQQSGSVRSQKNMTITGQNLINNGKISADTGIIKATINGDISNIGSIAANNHIILSASGNINNYSGYILTDQTGYIHIQGNSLNNQNGLIQTNSGLINLVMNSVNNNGGSVVTRDAEININAPQYIFNNNGQIGSQQSGSINLITQNDLQNNNGKISTRLGNVFLQSNKLMNNSGIILAGIEKNSGDITIRSGDVGNSGGVIQSTSGLVDVSMGGYTDTASGLIYAGKILKINATEDVSVGGDIQGQQGLSLSARSLTLNNAKASLSSLIGDSMISLLNGLVNAGNIFANQGILTITAGSLTNNGQIITNAGTLSVTTKGDISNRSGHILTKNDAITLKAEGKIDNGTGQIGLQNNGAITLQGGDVNNENGLIRTGIGDISLTVASLDNNSGSILTRQGNIGISSSQGMMNRLGQIGNQVSGNLIITAGGDINNQQGQLITPSGWVRVTSRDLDNRLGKIGSNNGNIELQTSRLSNGQGIILAGAGSNIGDITLQSGDIENSHGTIQATNGSVNAFLNNYTDMGSGVVYAGKSLQINATGDMYIEGAIQSQDQLNLRAY